MWVIEDDLGRCLQSSFLLVREGSKLAVLQLEKLSEKIDTEL